MAQYARHEQHVFRVVVEQAGERMAQPVDRERRQVSLVE
jgi:hypothetical protein